MIVKSFEINKINLSKINFFLFYGENEGLKNEIINNKFKNKYVGNIFRYEEKEILNEKDSFLESILNGL